VFGAVIIPGTAETVTGSELTNWRRASSASRLLHGPSGQEYSRAPMDALPRLTICCFVLAGFVSRGASAHDPEPSRPQAVIETSPGEIRVARHPVHPPAQTANLLPYVEEHFFPSPDEQRLAPKVNILRVRRA